MELPHTKICRLFIVRLNLELTFLLLHFPAVFVVGRCTWHNLGKPYLRPDKIRDLWIDHGKSSIWLTNVSTFRVFGNLRIFFSQIVCELTSQVVGFMWEFVIFKNLIGSINITRQTITTHLHLPATRCSSSAGFLRKKNQREKWSILRIMGGPALDAQYLPTFQKGAN